MAACDMVAHMVLCTLGVLIHGRHPGRISSLCMMRTHAHAGMMMLLPSAVASPDRRITCRHRREQCSKLHSLCRRSLLHQPWCVTAPSLSNGSTCAVTT